MIGKQHHQVDKSGWISWTQKPAFLAYKHQESNAEWGERLFLTRQHLPIKQHHEGFWDLHPKPGHTQREAKVRGKTQREESDVPGSSESLGTKENVIKSLLSPKGQHGRGRAVIIVNERIKIQDRDGLKKKAQGGVSIHLLSSRSSGSPETGKDSGIASSPLPLRR